MSEIPAYIRAARTQPCPYCNASIGQPCRDKSGRANTTHADRQRATWGAYHIGYETGLRDALALLDWEVTKRGLNTTVAQVRERIAGQHDMVWHSNRRDEVQ